MQGVLLCYYEARTIDDQPEKTSFRPQRARTTSSSWKFKHRFYLWFQQNGGFIGYPLNPPGSATNGCDHASDVGIICYSQGIWHVYGDGCLYILHRYNQSGPIICRKPVHGWRHEAFWWREWMGWDLFQRVLGSICMGNESRLLDCPHNYGLTEAYGYCWQGESFEMLW